MGMDVNTVLIQERVTGAATKLVDAKLNGYDVLGALDPITIEALAGLAADDRSQVAQALNNMVFCLTW
jgi:hypothetical protein